MTIRILKIYTLLLILFFADNNAFSQTVLAADFLLVGIIFLSLNFYFFHSIVPAVFFGYLKDSAVFNVFPVNTIFFVFIVFAARYFVRNFQAELPSQFPFAAAVIVLYLITNSAVYGSFNPEFLFRFFVHTFAAFVFISYFAKKWVFLR